MTKLVINHNHKGKLIINQSKLLGKLCKKSGDIHQQWACTYARKTEQSAHANKSRGNYDPHR
jgi:hypothetical protein